MTRARRQLAAFRHDIDALDCKLIELLGERFAIISRVARFKQNEGMPARIPTRIKTVLERREAAGRGLGFPSFAAAHIWATIVEESCLLEERLMADMQLSKTSEMTAATSRSRRSKSAQSQPKSAKVRRTKIGCAHSNALTIDPGEPESELGR